jgi:hypothetical protein
MATSAGTKGTMNHVLADHLANPRDVTIWVKNVNVHLISLVFYAVYFHMFLKYLPYPGSPDETTRLGCVYAIACRR